MFNTLHLRAPTPSWAQTIRSWFAPATDARPVTSATSLREQALEQTIERLRARERQLEREAHYDGLTGLANRKLLRDRFQCAVQRAKRSRTCFALLMIDLDGFKAINDNHGHAAGDAVLVAMARRMTSALRTSDTAARLGGDEFVLIVEAIQDPQELQLISRKLSRALLQDIRLPDGSLVSVGASIGLAMYPDDGLHLAQMLCIADKAMYECKASAHMGLTAL